MVKALGHANQKIVKDYATRSGEALDWMLAELDPDYARTAQGSPVRRLASTLGVKCRGVQRYGKIAVRGHAAQHSSAEL